MSFCLVDINECDLDLDNCDENAACTDTDGSFICECNDGFSGMELCVKVMHKNFGFEVFSFVLFDETES